MRKMNGKKGASSHKRLVALLATFILVARSLFGWCRGRPTTTVEAGGTTAATTAPAPSDEPVELTVWFTQEEGTPSFDDFEAENPNISVSSRHHPLGRHLRAAPAHAGCRAAAP